MSAAPKRKGLHSPQHTRKPRAPFSIAPRPLPRKVVEPPKRRVLWRALRGSQVLAIACRCNVICYEGTRGPGKSDAQLMYFRQFVGKGYGTFWRGVIFDRTYKGLDDLVAKSKRWFSDLGDGAQFLAAKSDYKWVWPTGEELLFRQIADARTYLVYHGQEFPYIGWNELTKWPKSDCFDAMMSCNRSSFLPEINGPTDSAGNRIPVPEIPLVVFCTTNPHGPGHMWVKVRFVDPAPAGKVIRTITNVYNPLTQQRENVLTTQVRIFGSYKENPFLSPQYVAQLENERDPMKRRAWLLGDWNITVGSALLDVWVEAVHIIPRFRVPKTWRISRSFDWGSTKPFSVGWYAWATGEDAKLPDGRIFCPPAGSLIRIFEWYGGEEIGTDTGLKLGSTAIAEGILERETIMRADGWILTDVEPGPADNQIYSEIDTSVQTIADLMLEAGVEWTRSDKSAGSRVQGLQLARDRLQAATAHEGPGLFVTDNCRAAVALLPNLPRSGINPDDVDSKSEDHLWDELRYMLLGGADTLGHGLTARF